MKKIVYLFLIFSFFLVGCKTRTVDESQFVKNDFLNVNDLSLFIGDEFTLVSPYDSEIDTKLIYYTSSDSNIASVSEDGLIVAKNIGEAKITAKTTNFLIDYVNINVFATPYIDLYEPSSSVIKGKKIQLEYDTNIANIDLDNIKWESSDTSIATIDQNGLLNPLETGNVVITLSFKGVSRLVSSSIDINIYNEEDVYFTEGLKFSFNDYLGGYQVSGYNGTDSNVIIPKYYLNGKVLKIGNDAFANCDFLISVTIPDSVTIIDDFAFYNCLSLVSINIPDSVTSIGRCAIYNCASLTSIIIPNSVKTMGSQAIDFYRPDVTGSIIIYCEATKRPNGCALDWTTCFVVWGYVEDDRLF